MTQPGGRMSMPAPRPGPLCKRFSSLLPLIFDESLLGHEAPETEAWREHIASCEYCQTMLALYGAQQESLRRSFAEQATSSPSYALAIIQRLEVEPIVSELPANPTPEQSLYMLQPDHVFHGADRTDMVPPAPERRVHPVVAWLVPVAATVLIALLAGTLFTTLHRTPTPTGTPGTTLDRTSTPAGTPVHIPASGAVSLASLPGIPLKNGSQISFIALSMLSTTEGWAIASTVPCISCNPGPDLILRDHRGVWSVITVAKMHDQYVDDNGGNWQPSDFWFTGLSAISPTDVWISTTAPDSYGRVSYVYVPYTYVLHFDGQTWTRQRVPNTIFTSLKMFSTSDGWAGGLYKASKNAASDAYEFFHYDGQTWSVLPKSPFPRCTSVPAGTGPPSVLPDGEMWEIGCLSYANGVPTSFSILHFDGTTWSQQPFPLPGAGVTVSVMSISMISPHEGWIIGNDITTSGKHESFLLQYNQGRWQLVPSHESLAQLPLQGGSVEMLGWFTMVSANDGWLQLTVGRPVAPDGTEIVRLLLHYTQGVWRQVQLIEQVGGMIFLPSGDAWAYGTISHVITVSVPPNGSEVDTVYVPLLLHYLNGNWSVVLD